MRKVRRRLRSPKVAERKDGTDHVERPLCLDRSDFIVFAKAIRHRFLVEAAHRDRAGVQLELRGGFSLFKLLHERDQRGGRQIQSRRSGVHVELDAAEDATIDNCTAVVADPNRVLRRDL